MPSYGAEMRGGTANCSVVVSDKQIGSPVVGMADILVAMNKPTILKYESKVRPGGTIIINSSIVDPAIITRKDVEIVEVKASDIASEIGSTKVANMVMCGTLMKVAPHLISVENAKKTIADKFGGKKAKFIPLNEEAIRRGME